MAIKGIINNVTGIIGKVKVRPISQTRIASPNFEPKVNISLGDIINVNVNSQLDGDTLIFDANTNTYIARPLTDAAIIIASVNGGRF